MDSALPDTGPASLHAERTLLGIVLNAPAWCAEVSASVSAADFTEPTHVVIWRAIAALHARGHAPSLAAVGIQLEDTGALAAAGGLPALADLARECPDGVGPAVYVAVLREKSRSRRLIELGRAISGGGADPTADAADILALAAEVAALAAPPKRPQGDPPPADELIVSEEELAVAQLTPRCIVRQHTYADVAQVVGAGGTGKTTTLIVECVCIALGWPVWGLPVESPGWSLIITAEDQRERLAARLREIMSAMELEPADRDTARRGVRFWDVSGEGVKLAAVADGNVILTTLADKIVEAYRADPPVLILFDPLVSFGASEQQVNDNEQALITAGRRIVKGLNCCVRLIHHTGKANARGGTLDQYSGRGGSALPDGTRMTTVLQSWSPENANGLHPPMGCHPGTGIGISVMARAKLSYAPPHLPLIWIRREGFRFEHFTEAPSLAPDAQRAAHADQLERFLNHELGQGRRYSARTLDASADRLAMSRKALREALEELQISGRVVDEPLPRDGRQGGRKTYLLPRANCAAEHGAVGPVCDSEPRQSEPPSTTAPPYREEACGAVPPEASPPGPWHCAANGRRSTAQLAQLENGANSEFSENSYDESCAPTAPPLRRSNLAQTAGPADDVTGMVEDDL